MAEPEAVVEAGTQEGRRGGVLPLVAVLLLTLGGGSAVGARLAGPRLGALLAERAAEAEEHQGPVTSILHLVDNLVVNPAGSGGSRFLLTTVALEASSPEVAATLALRDVELRHAFTLVLASRTVEQLIDVSSRETLTRDLAAAAEAVMGPGAVLRVLIPQFVVQ